MAFCTCRAGGGNGARRDGREQFVGARLAQRGLAAAHILARGLHGGLVGLQAGDRIVLGLLAHDSLLGQGHGAGGVGLLMLEVGLRLGQRSLRHADLGLGVGGGAG